MKKLLVLSGKGGTGKTTVAAAFIDFSHAWAFADCDVDAPNLHLVQSVDGPVERSDFSGSQKARVDSHLCVGCGRCVVHCRFDAIHLVGTKASVKEFACEGCGVCVEVCPAQAVSLAEDVSGTTTLYRGGRIFSTAELKMGRGNSGKLVSTVKRTLVDTVKRAGESSVPLCVIDGSPGIGCPVIASMSGVDLVLVVAEPSLSGLSDLRRLFDTATMFGTKMAVCINKFDISDGLTGSIEHFCEEHDVPFVGKIPYDRHAVAAVNAGVSLAYADCPASKALRTIYDRTMLLL